NRLHRSVPGASMGPRDADRGDACRLRFAGPGRQSSVHRRVELHRMAARAHGADGAKPRPVRACLAAAAVQHAGSGDRMGDRPGVAAPLLGARNAEQLRDNLLAADLTLDERQRSELDDVSAPMTPDYPYRLLAEGTAERRRLL